MMLIIGVQAYRNEATQAALKAQLDQIQTNTKQPPQVTVNIPPSSSIPPSPPKSRGFLEFEKLEFVEKDLVEDGPFFVNVYVKNDGTEPIYHTQHYFGVKLFDVPPNEKPELVDTMAQEEFSKDARKSLKDAVANHLPGSEVNVGGVIWATLGFASLTKTQIAGIVSGDTRFYVLTWGRWDNGEKGLNSCMWLQWTGTTKISEWKPVWHYCGG